MGPILDHMPILHTRDIEQTHAGRFAVAYRQRFGESPSATLENRRRRSA